MSLRATFPAGVTDLTVHGLHQWDYGRTLEIQADDLPPALVEVHFVCPGMKDAIVRACSVEGGVAVAAIPDQCLEQSAPITAWVYAVGESSGETIKTIALTVIPRARPQAGKSIPEEISNKYTKAVGAMNDAVASVANGDVVAKKAEHAKTATRALNADRATDADKAETASFAHVAYETDQALSLRVNDISNELETINGAAQYSVEAITQRNEGIYIGFTATTCGFLFLREGDAYNNTGIFGVGYDFDNHEGLRYDAVKKAILWDGGTLQELLYISAKVPRVI